MKDFDQDTSIEVFDIHNESENKDPYAETERVAFHHQFVLNSIKELKPDVVKTLRKNDYGSYKVLYLDVPKNIQNYDFYNAYRKIKISEAELRIEDQNEIQAIKLKKLFFEGNCFSLSFYFLIFVFGIVIVSFSFKYQSFKKACIIIGIIVIGLIILLLIFWKIRKLLKIQKDKKFEQLKEYHPYYRLCSKIKYKYFDDYVEFLKIPVSQIEDKYIDYEDDIESAWDNSSGEFITNRFFRFKPIEGISKQFGHYRFFIEIDYEDCFPDYPELVNIEQHFNPDEYESGDAEKIINISDFKNIIKDSISNMITERIPGMKLEDIKIAAVFINHPLITEK